MKVVNFIYLTLLLNACSCEALVVQTENQFCNLRKSTTQIALGKFIESNLTAKKAPKIGVALSGGGYRALIESAGFIEALSQIGLWDATSYITALSGSTWAIGTYLALKKIDSNFSLLDLSLLIKKNVSKKLLDESVFFNTNFEKILTEKRLAQQVVGVVDLWGELVLNVLLGDVNGHENLRFSELVPDPAKSPLPIFTATVDLCKQRGWWDWVTSVASGFSHKYEFMEISPLRTSCDFFSKGISTSLLNSYFEKHCLLIRKPEPTLGYLFGVCGSAFCIGWQDVFNFIQESYFKKKPKGMLEIFCKEVLDEIKDSILKGRICPAQIFNFAYNPKIKYSDKYLTIGDGGLIANIPLLPLITRDVDIVLVCDASASAENGEFNELKKAVKFVEKHGLKMPSMKKPYLDYGNVKLFSDPTDKTIPTIIYFKCNLDTVNTYGTLKLQYSPQEFDEVHNQMMGVVLGAPNIIKAAITQKLA